MDGAAMDSDAGMSEEEDHDVQYDSRQLGYNPQVQDGGYDPQLENVRMESIRKIRGRFEHIYQKYGKDFDGVGDEIDMATGVIVVNNGHLQNMEHEVDAGNGDALALSRTFGDDVDDDDDEEDGGSSSDSEVDVVPEGGDDSNSISSDNPELDFSWQDDTAASLTSIDQDDDVLAKPMQTITRRPSTPTNGSSRRKGKEHSNDGNTTSDASSREATVSDDIFGGLKDSMLALQGKYKSGQEMAPDDIQALGMSIANQLASFITGGKSSKKRKRQSSTNRAESAERSRGRRRRRSSHPVDPVAPTPARSPGSKSLWAPLVQPKGQRRPKKKPATAAADDAADDAADNAGDDSLIDSMVLQTIMHQSALEPDELQGPTTVRSCSNCKTTETLSWRRGPKAIDLCNNCGMYYYRYGLMRPLHKSPPRQTSPTPSEEEEEVDPRRKSAPYSANTSRPLDGINLFGLHFSAREDAQVIKLKEIDRLTWDQIAMQHPGRTPYALQCRYSKVLSGKACEARDILSNRGYQFYVDANGHTVARQPGPFTEEEDDMLLKLREEDALDWDAIALELPGRIAEDVEDRYEELARELLGDDQDARPAKVKPKSKSKPKKKRRRDSSASERSGLRYTPAEDDTILRLREDDKRSWRDIANQMPGRTLGSVQRHYSRDIGPYGRSRSSTPRGSPAPGEAPARLRKYTTEEDAKLMRLRDEEDLEWEEIAQQIPDRTATSLENRYYYKTRKDDSCPSSRATSVRSSSARRKSVSLPAVDLEAQLDDAQDEVLSGEETFTEAEDSLIIKLRELECLSWDQIAAEMPGRDVSSISCRYYQYLLPQKAPEVRGTNHGLDAALQSSGFHAQADDSQVPQIHPELRAEDGPAHEPIVTATGASSTGHKQKSRKRKNDAGSNGRPAAARRSDAPMLRRALQKNLNRRSEPNLALPGPLPDMGMMMDGANDRVLVDSDQLSTDRAAPELLPSALLEGSYMRPSYSEHKQRPGSKRKSAYPETPLRPSNGPVPTSGLTPLDHSFYVTPSRYQVQSHPYFVANAAPPEPRPQPAFPKKRVRRAPSYAELDTPVDESEEEPAFEKVMSSSRKRRRAPKPSRPTCSRQIQVDDTDEGEDDFESDDDDDAGGEYFTSRKKKRASSAQQSFRCRVPATGKRRDEVEIGAVAGRTRAQSSEAEDETDEEDIDMPDLGTDDDLTSSESDEEEDDDELRCKPRERSPLFDPRDTIEEAKQKKDRPTNSKITAAAKAGDGNTMDDLNTEIDVSAIPPEHRVRPDISWTQLNFLALKSCAPEPMYTRDIYAYLEEHFPFFRICKGHWRDSIRGNLSTRPEFVKFSATKSALWCLADPNQDAVAVPKGSRRGRCPSGVERAPKEVNGPKRKPGRPSNISKGLPLKRIYKRNYIPAAERRRLAALEAERAANAWEGDTAADNAPKSNGAEQPITQSAAAVVGQGAHDGAAAIGALAFSRPSMTLPGPGRAFLALAPRPSTDNRPARASTIEDSDAGEQFEFAECPPEPPGVKTEKVAQLPEPEFVAPIAPMTAMPDINRKPQSSDAADVHPPAAVDVQSSCATPDTNRELRSSDAAERDPPAAMVEQSLNATPDAKREPLRSNAAEPDQPAALDELPSEDTSDINHDTQSSDAAEPNLPAAVAEPFSDSTPNSVFNHAGPGLRSSSPALATTTTSRRLSRTYGRATPGTARSTLFRQLAPASASSAIVKGSPALAKLMGSRAGTPSSLRRTVQTPVRDAEGSEDELA